MRGILSTISSAERDRLEALHGYGIMDTLPEEDFDDIAKLAAQLCGTPMALVSLVASERQWFKARVGMPVCETARDISFCTHAMNADTVMMVPDARVDPRFAENPLVLGEPHIRFYAGAPLVTPLGSRLGTLCVLDTEPGALTIDQQQGLLVLARHVIVELELRQHLRDSALANRRLGEADRLKEQFLGRINHELRTPLTSIRGYLEVLQEGKLSPEAATKFLETVSRNTDRLVRLVDDMLLVAQLNAETIVLHPAPADLRDVVVNAVRCNEALAAVKGLAIVADAPLSVPADIDPKRFAQALDRLVLNAIKFTASGRVVVRVALTDAHPVVEVRDTGMGFHEDAAQLFEPFHRASNAERGEVQGAGLGLAIVKAIIEGHRGTISMRAVPGVGTTVVVTLPEAAQAVAR